ncbi:hypothetical protein ACLOJK_000459 [Asimina triloba]
MMSIRDGTITAENPTSESINKMLKNQTNSAGGNHVDNAKGSLELGLGEAKFNGASDKEIDCKLTCGSYKTLILVASIILHCILSTENARHYSKAVHYEMEINVIDLD